MPLPILAAIAVAQGIAGVLGANKASKDFNAANAQRKPLQTPDELYKILNAVENNQGGFDAQSLSYLTNQSDRAFLSSLDTVQRLGGDPNDAAGIFDQKIQGIMKIAVQNNAIGMEKFSQLLSAYDAIGNAKLASQVSEQNIIKDRMQAANANRQAAFGNTQSAVNTGVSAFAANQMNNLYKTDDAVVNASFQSAATNPTTAYVPREMPNSNAPYITPRQSSVRVNSNNNYVSANAGNNSFNYLYPNWGYIPQ